MALLRNSEVKKMSDENLKEKLQELKMELVRANVTANKTRAKTKELKRAISRVLTAMTAKKQPKSPSQVKLNPSKKTAGLGK